MTAIHEEAPRTPPRLLIRIVWVLHRTAHRISGGGFGLSRPVTGSRFGMLRLTSVGRRMGQPRVAIIGYHRQGMGNGLRTPDGWRRPPWFAR